MKFRMNIRWWLIGCFLAPVAALLVFMNAAVWKHVIHAHARKYEDHRAHAQTVVEQRLYAEAIRLRSLAVLPHVDSLLTVTERGQRHLSRQGMMERIGEREAEWSDLQRDALAVRNVLNNSVGELFRYLVEGDPEIDLIFLTDSAGALIAASDKTDRYGFGHKDWWVLSREQHGPQVVSMGRIEDGTLGLAMPVGYGDGDASFRGVLRQVVRLPEGSEPARKRGRRSMATAIVGEEAWPLSGSREVFEQYAGSLVEAVSRTPVPKREWRDGMRYEAQPVDAEIVWARPVWVVSFRPEGRFPLAVYGPIAGSFLISLALFALVVRAAHGVAQKNFIEPYTEILRAGQWALRNAPKHLRRPATAKRLDRMDAVIKNDEPTTLESELDEWIARLQEDVKNAASARAHEVQHDLDLARDFQQAYLHRPFPKIPEVHYEGRLRLEFHHSYRPALALGGDFYDVLPLASDCAGIFIADVMGHGARSALITAMLRTLLRDLSGQGRNARHFIAELNKQFCALLRAFPNPLFASAFYFVPDVTSRIATYAAAGHPPPYHIRRTMGRIMRLRIPRTHGAALGLLPSEEYPGGHVRLINGDVFIFFTDGVYEATNPQGEEFGLERLEKVLRRLMYKNVRAIIDGIMEAVTEFTGGEPVLDDICLVAVEVTTAAESPTAESGARQA